ncbi:bifunctional glutamate N-acetyltransferase/amino-acid acetyltransferase ArgJ [Dictyobacter arantiisoli]|uniref:Arginine biosynthesis bifunctional protein ArgJ n=1 Tax=Dictyobacter arantiisoli TaxID=2014874 RepID=A0A5A5TJB0_9CHLR|nr:bifunctional glutamate N-acetyltransferase/amino-acid acetyltransferase ArgJ [Dictyobacter arantiisoli]GCF11099.1 arginine biosynthesis bifunctional protein ArgJ 2 [Dictyobacter arantiisoli]
MQSLPFYPQGFRSCAKNIGIRDTTLDFTVIASDVPAAAAAMFTQSRFCGAAITVGREHVTDGQLQAFVINSKNANVSTGAQGLANIREIVQLVADELHIAPQDVLPSSTGVIGWQLPMDKVRAGIRGFGTDMREGQLHVSAHAIMTTDTRPKLHARKIGDAVLVGMAKGVGMIEPNMATMLSYFVTDARIPADQLKQCLQEVVNLTFNMVSVDTDTSTSDTVAIMANGLAGEVPLADFRQALLEMATELARDIARDGEGATKLLEVTVEHAASFEQAKRVAKSIVNSPLVKTAIFGTDPNWGRVAMAIGKCSEYTDIVPEKVSIAFGDLLLFQGDAVDQVDLAQLKAYLHNSEVTIHVSLGIGDARATVWGCDLSYEYVRINGEYTT